MAIQSSGELAVGSLYATFALKREDDSLAGVVLEEVSNVIDPEIVKSIRAGATDFKTAVDEGKIVQLFVAGIVDLKPDIKEANTIVELLPHRDDLAPHGW